MARFVDRIRFRILGIAAVTVLACTGSMTHLHPIPQSNTRELSECAGPAAPCAGEITFTYLGVGGFIIRDDSEAVMTAPSFSHPGLLAVATPKLGRIHSSAADVDRQVRRLLGDRFDTSMARVRAVLVGHSHYDHAMDVPYLMQRYVPTARLVGGTTTKRILVGDSWMREHRAQIDEIPIDSAGTPWRIGQWVPVGDHMRVMALQSSHAPNFLGVTIASGRADKDYDHLPGTAWGWLMGDPYAYLIDVLDARGRPVFRILYQDAASNPINALLPLLPDIDRREVDVAIICAGNFASADQYPAILAGALHPRFIIVGHWEDFFHSMDDDVTPVRFTRTEQLEARLDTVIGGRWHTPEPGATIRVRYPGADRATAGR